MKFYLLNNFFTAESTAVIYVQRTSKAATPLSETMKTFWACILCTLSATLLSEAASAENAVDSHVAKYSTIFSSFSPKSVDGMERRVAYLQFAQDVPQNQQAIVLALMFSDDPKKDGSKESAIVEYLTQCKQRDPAFQVTPTLESKIYSKVKSPAASVRAAAFAFVCVFKPDDHRTILMFLEDTDDSVRTGAIDRVADWSDSRDIVLRFYESSKNSPDYAESVKRAKARLHISP